MSIQPLCLCERHHVGGDTLEPFFAYRHNVELLEEVIHRQRRSEPSGPEGGQHMARTRDVVADGCWRQRTTKHRACVAHVGNQRLGAVAQQFEMLGGNDVRYRYSLLGQIGRASCRERVLASV